MYSDIPKFPPELNIHYTIVSKNIDSKVKHALEFTPKFLIGFSYHHFYCFAYPCRIFFR
jgi:hypothetical protein